jgi:hypothetical protein
VPPQIDQFQINTPPQQEATPATPTPTTIDPGGPAKGVTGGTGGTKQVTVGGPHATKDLYQLAKQYHITEAQLLKMNPGLKKYEGSKKPIPVKTKIKV